MKIRDIAPENNYVCIETANGDLVNFDVFEYGEADDYESIKKNRRHKPHKLAQ